MTVQSESVTNMTATTFVCNYLYNCQQENGTKVGLILALLLTKSLASILESGNIVFHSIMKDNKLVRMRKYLFRHALSQDMAFYDSKTAAEIKSSINPTPVIDIISWEVPYILTDILNVLFVVYHMMQINSQLTVISIFFIVLCQVIQYPIQKVQPIVNFYCGSGKYFNFSLNHFSSVLVNVASHLIQKYELLTKLDEKLKTLMRQAQDDSINMITTVKFFRDSF